MEKSLKIGTVLKGNAHDYLIEKVLGSGTFGITYLAEVVLHTKSAANTSVKVTIKEFFMKDFNDREGSSVTIGSKNGYFVKYLDKFIRESDKLSKISSTGVVKVLERFQANNTAYYVMQYLSGGSLNDLIATRGCIPENIALQFTQQIAYALRDLHEKMMLHLDLKPSNIMLTRDHETVLIDFGLSKQYSEDGEPESSTSVGCGTRGYAPIEQSHYRDGHGFPATMDIYALGATLYKMLTGNVPPDASSILNDGFPEKTFEATEVSVIVKDFVKRLMSPVKKSRPQNMEEVISELHSINARISIADKDEVSSWIIQKSFSSHQTDDTEVEIISVLGGSIKKDEPIDTYCEYSSIDKIELKLIADQTKPYDYIWISVIATPTNLIVLKHKKGEQFPLKKSYFYTKEKFDNLKARIKGCDIKFRSIKGTDTRKQYGISLKTYSQERLVFDASSYYDGSSRLIEGHTDELASLIWRLSGLISLDYLSSKNQSSMTRFINFIRTPKKWIGYLVIVAITVFTYIYYNPIESFIDNNYKKDLVYRDDGLNHPYTLEGNDSSTIMYYQNEAIMELPPSDWSSVEKDHKALYKINCHSNNYGFLSAIYDNKGHEIIPFNHDSKIIIADNVIKIINDGKSSYFDNNGYILSKYDFIVIYDKFGVFLNTCMILLLSLCLCLITRFLYRLFLKHKPTRSVDN